MALKMVSVIAALAVIAAGAAQAGDKGLGVPPPPKGTSNEALIAWAKRYIKDDGWSTIVTTEKGVVLVSPDTMEFTRNNTLKFWIRIEFTEPNFADKTRSIHMLEEIDCGDGRFRTLAVDGYALNSMQGDKVSEENNADGKWEFARPDTVDEMVNDKVCDYVDKLVEEEAEKQDAEKVGVRGHF